MSYNLFIPECHRSHFWLKVPIGLMCSARACCSLAPQAWPQAGVISVCQTETRQYPTPPNMCRCRWNRSAHWRRWARITSLQIFLDVRIHPSRNPPSIYGALAPSVAGKTITTQMLGRYWFLSWGLARLEFADKTITPCTANHKKPMHMSKC